MKEVLISDLRGQSGAELSQDPNRMAVFFS